MIAIIGTSSFKYHTFREARKASRQINAARVGLILCESWRGLEGDETYDPATYFSPGLTIEEGDGPDAPEDFTLLNSYTFTLDETTYYTTLSWKEVATDLRALNITVVWDQYEQEEGTFDDADKSFTLTSYASID